jgi:hypothetical protein
MEPSREFLSYEGVGVSLSKLWQSERRRVVLEIKREEVEACALCYGSPEERPLFSLLTGVALMAPGYFPLRHLIVYFSEPSAEAHLAGLRYELAIMLFAGLGAWLVYRSVAGRRYFLKISRPQRSHKLVFSAKATLPGVVQFVDEARTRFGLACVDRIQEDTVSGASGR